jgi:predicted secreted protein
MSDAIAGYKATMSVSTAEGSSFAELAELRDYSLSAQHNEIDVTSHRSSGDREVIAGISQWSGSADLLSLTTDATERDVADVLLGRIKVDFEFHPTGSSSDGFFSGTGFVTGYDLSAPNEDALSVSLGFVGDGVLARSSSQST